MRVTTPGSLHRESVAAFLPAVTDKPWPEVVKDLAAQRDLKMGEVEAELTIRDRKKASVGTYRRARAGDRKPSAYDSGTRANMEHTIERVLRSRVTAKLPGIGIQDVSVSCSADSKTTFVCDSTISASFGGGQCGQLTARQAGTVEESGDLSWRPDGGDHQRVTPC